MLVEPNDLQPDWVILDVGQWARYQQLHIPGARFIAHADLIAAQPNAPGACPSAEVLPSLYAAWGLRPEDTVVVYDDQAGCAAGRLFWTLDLCQHPKTYYLNGGLSAWLQAGKPVTAEVPIISSTAPCQVNLTPLATYSEVRSALKDPKTIIWDARSPEEYAKGHMPGAHLYPWSRALMDPCRIAPLPLIQADLAACGIEPNAQIITHCHSHHRSAFCYMLGKILGFPHIRGYAGSWSEWSSHSDSPIEVSAC